MTESENKIQSASTSNTRDTASMVDEMLNTIDKGFTESELLFLDCMCGLTTFSIADEFMIDEIYNRRM